MTSTSSGDLQAGPPTPAELSAAVQLLALRLPRLGERHLGLPPLPRSELEVLVMVVEGPQRSVTDVARELGLQTSNVSTTVHQLVEKGLVERLPHPADRRSTLLVATPQALADKAAIDEAWAMLVGRFLAGLSPADRDALLAATPVLAAMARIAPGRPSR